MSDQLTGSDVEILLDLELELNAADKCEHKGHWWRSARHSDDSGAWLAVVFCPCHEPQENIFCGKYKNWCTERFDAIVNCTYCGRLKSPAQAYQWIKKL